MSNPLVDPRAQRDLDAAAGRDKPAAFAVTAAEASSPGDASVFSEQTRAEAREIMARYPAGQQQSALLPMLHLVQSVQGYVSPDGIAFCAEMIGLTNAQVLSVASYYTMFKRKPTGDYLVSVCTNTLCGMLGGDEILAALQSSLGLEVGHASPGTLEGGRLGDGNRAADGQRSADGKITVEHAECLAACDYAPVLTVNYEYFDNQTVGSARNIVDQLASGARPRPTRGAPLCTFAEIERQIAGFITEEQFAADSPATGEATEAGVRLAVQRGESAPSYANSSDEPGDAASESDGE